MSTTPYDDSSNERSNNKRFYVTVAGFAGGFIAMLSVFGFVAYSSGNAARANVSAVQELGFTNVSSGSEYEITGNAGRCTFHMSYDNDGNLYTTGNPQIRVDSARQLVKATGLNCYQTPN